MGVLMDKQTNIVKLAFIRKVKGKGWCVLGHKKIKGGKHRNFGCYKTQAEAKKRLSQIHFFKGRGALDGMVSVADELDKKGMLHFADALMDCLEKVIVASLGDPVDEKPASVTLGKIAALLENRGELILAEKLDAILPAVQDVECGADCPDCPDIFVSADLGRCHNITRNVSADRLYAIAVHYRNMYREGMVDEASFEYRKFREFRFLLKSGFIFSSKDQNIPSNCANWWEFFEKGAGNE
jgi:hypothetical protein